MHILYFVLLLVGGVCFLAAAATATKPHRAWPALVPLGLLAWILVPLIQQAKLIHHN